jgi:predicted membrane-bound spermidine synthase
MESESKLRTALVLPLIILIEGFVSISIEILAIRQLLPVAGGSVIVTSLIIGVFLLFLALGYQQGGKLKLDPQKVLQNNFFIAGIWAGVGLSYFFVTVFFYYIEKITGPHLVYPLIAYLVIILAPLIFILGQTVPIIMNMVRQNRSAGIIGGNMLGLSTLGSFLGATLTTLVLMHYLGVAWTLVINFIFIESLVLILTTNRSSFFTYSFIILLSAIVIYLFNISVEKSLEIKSNNYGNYQILDQSKLKLLAPNEKILMINDVGSSYINPQKKGFPYIETIKKILFADLNLHQANILILGAGGFSLTAERTNGNHITYVDIDSQIKKIAVPDFIDKVNGELIIDDARHFLKSTQQYYQAIVIDTYSDVKAIPAHLLTIEFMKEIKARLAPNGVALFNIIANPFFSDLYSKRIDNTIRAIFLNCVSIPETYADRATNIIYACHNSKTNDDRIVYSDNLNTSTTDSFNW